LAIAQAGLREGKKVGRWNVALKVAAAAGGLDAAKLLGRAQAPETTTAAQATTAEFHVLQVTQRPTFLIENSIGDRAVFSGIVRAEPLMGGQSTRCFQTRPPTLPGKLILALRPPAEGRPSKQPLDL
jgi:protein-disulfide isomerase-like protein with CxxC motif